MGYFEIHPVYGHLGCMEFMVQPTQSELIKQVGYFNEKISGTCLYMVNMLII